MIRLLRDNWDAVLSIVAAGLFWVVVGISTRPLLDASGLLAAGIALGATVGLAAFVAGRWFIDWLLKDELGEVIRRVEHDGSRVQHPYNVVTLAGLLTSLLGIILSLTAKEFSRAGAVVAYGLMFGLSIYCILGTITLVLNTRELQRLAATLRSTKEQLEREAREADRQARGAVDPPQPTVDE